VRADETFNPEGVPVLIARMGWFQRVQIFAGGAAASQPLAQATDLREFGGAHDGVFIIPNGLQAGQSLYVRVAPVGDGMGPLRFHVSTLDATLARAAAHSRMIAIAFGALTAMSLGALLIWFILKDRLFLLYPALFFLEALYLIYFSGQGFDWPLFSYAKAVSAYTWNVPVALGGAVACLFIREIADLKHTSPRAYTVFGWLAWTFVALAFSNVANLVGNPVLAENSSLEWFNIAAFTRNPVITGSPVDGNSGRNLLSQPGFRTVDLAVFREFRFREKYGMEFRAETTNTFNMVNLNAPNGTVGSSTFGQISSAGSMRQLQLGLRLTY